jgi:UDP-N-acetylmuramoylalanine--D-glutamate ligase
VEERRAILFGLARTNIALARFLVGEGVQVTISDKKPAEQLQNEIRALENLPVRLLLGEQKPEDFSDADIIYITPGAPRDLPVFQAARETGIPFSSEIELLFERCPVPIIAITGSSGKTTTTTLTGEMLKATFGADRVFVGGNIGTPLIDKLDQIAATPNAKVVLELSSFQLEYMQRSPHIAAVLNITPNHLDRHGTMEAYTLAKSQILRHQHTGDYAILNTDDPGAASLRPLVRGTLVEYSMEHPVTLGSYLENERVILNLQEPVAICEAGELKLMGRHNLQNVLAACTIAGTAGATPTAMRQVATTFTGVPHRLELVRELHGVRYYNDSIATAPERTMAALRAIPDSTPVVLIAGGKHKNVPLDEMARMIVQRVGTLLLTGADAGLIEAAVREAQAELHSEWPAIVRCDDLQACVEQAAARAPKGAVVLLSPACTSYDRYRDFEERGQEFRDLVNRLD